MTRFLLKIFIKNYENTSDLKVRENYGKFSGIVGIISNLLLFLIKFITGLVFNSISIIADAVNNLSDFASSLITVVGFKLSGKPADEEHPYGHARIEYISGLIISFLVLILGLQLAKSSIEKIIYPETADFGIVVIGILVISILLKFWQGTFYKKIGKAIHSTTLKATAADSMNDVFSTSAVLAGMILTKLTGFNLDGYMGLLVAILILVSGFRLVIDTSNPLLGVAPTKEMVNEIYEKILKYDGVIGIHDLNVHNYGEGRCFASLHCEMPASQDIMISHDIIDNIERDFLKEMGIHLVIHLDPVVTDDLKTNELKEKVKEVVKTISPELSIHDFRVVWGATHSNLIFDVLVPFGFSIADSELLHLIEEKIAEIDNTYIAVLTIDHSYVPKT